MSERMTILEFAEKFLPPPVRKRYLYNCTHYLGYGVSLSRGYIDSPDAFITRAFPPFKTSEGVRYWNEIARTYTHPLEN